MAAISEATRFQIKQHLEGTLENVVKRQKRKLLTQSDHLQGESLRGELKPFHAALLPTQALQFSSFERGFSTALGKTFEFCAELIAREHHQEAEREYLLSGTATKDAFFQTDQQVRLFAQSVEKANAKNKKPPPPTWSEMIHAVQSVVQEASALQTITVRSDLFVLGKNGTEYYFELKTPQINKGQCADALRRVLIIHLARQSSSSTVKALLAMPYNPYGRDRTTYNRSIAKKYLPFDEIVVIGHEFWELIGGANTYEELLAIYQEVGREKAQVILDSLSS